jgi:hypothetical protein
MNVSGGNQYDAACKKWKLDSGVIVRILRSFKPISGTTLDLAYDNLQCELVGEVRISGVPYRMKINAGSYFILKTSDTTYIFGDNDKKFLKYFITGMSHGEVC